MASTKHQNPPLTQEHLNMSTFVRKQLSNPIAQHKQLIAQPIIKAAELENMLLANQLLNDTKHHCQQLDAQSHQHIQTAVQNASQQVFTQADLLLTQLNQQQYSEQQQQLTALLPQITRLIQQALQSLLVELPSQQKLESLLKQLMQNCTNNTKVTLHCHIDHKPILEQLLKHYDNHNWQVSPDPQLEKHTLRLEDPQGSYQASISLSLQAIEQIFAQHAGN